MAARIYSATRAAGISEAGAHLWLFGHVAASIGGACARYLAMSLAASVGTRGRIWTSRIEHYFTYLFVGDPPGPSAAASLPLFTPSTNASNLASLAAAVGVEPSIPATGEDLYNPAGGLPSCLVRRNLELDFVEMTDLLPDAWLQEESQPVMTLDGQVLLEPPKSHGSVRHSSLLLTLLLHQ